jgi:hypothetical protein
MPGGSDWCRCRVVGRPVCGEASHAARGPCPLSSLFSLKQDAPAHCDHSRLRLTRTPSIVAALCNHVKQEAVTLLAFAALLHVTASPGQARPQLNPPNSTPCDRQHCSFTPHRWTHELTPQNTPSYGHVRLDSSIHLSLPARRACTCWCCGRLCDLSCIQPLPVFTHQLPASKQCRPPSECAPSPPPFTEPFTDGPSECFE